VTQIEVRDDPDGTRVITINSEDFTPEAELAPWLQTFINVVQLSGRPGVLTNAPSSRAVWSPDEIPNT
jgi:hypothetical protein